MKNNTNFINYEKIFIKTFKIKKPQLKNLEYNKIPEWDSIGHMTLIAALEKAYKINIETDDIVDFSSFKKGITILKKYKINL
jgi:acyl carrier protein